MAAEGVRNTGVSQRTQGTVKHQGVVVELSQVFMFGQLQDVQTPAAEKESQLRGSLTPYVCKVEFILQINLVFVLYNVI